MKQRKRRSSRPSNDAEALSWPDVPREEADPSSIDAVAARVEPVEATVAHPSRTAFEPALQKRNEHGQWVSDMGVELDLLASAGERIKQLEGQHGKNPPLQIRVLMEKAVFEHGLLDAAAKRIKKHGAISRRSGKFLPIVHTWMELSESLVETLKQLDALKPKVVIETEEQAMAYLRDLFPDLGI